MPGKIVRLSAPEKARMEPQESSTHPLVLGPQKRNAVSNTTTRGVRKHDVENDYTIYPLTTIVLNSYN